MDRRLHKPSLHQPSTPPVRPSGLSEAGGGSHGQGRVSNDELVLDLTADLPPPPPVPSGNGGPRLHSVADEAISAPAPVSAPLASGAVQRDRIVVLGRRRAGKTIYPARLYEALWQGCKLVDGHLLPAGEKPNGRAFVEMSCRSTTGTAHQQFMRTVDELGRGKWPAATSGNSYAEIVVTHAGRDHVLTALDYPGEVFRKAFMADSSDSDAMELRAAVDRAAAAILLIDPSVVAAGGEEAQEDVFGLTAAALRIRESQGGDLVPIAIVFTKCDSNAAFLREAGGVRAFAAKHFGPLLREIDRTSVFACAAVRLSTNSLGKSVPRTDRLPENVVEPVRYCLSFLERGVDLQRAKAARAERANAVRAAQEAEVVERKRSATAWVVFAVAMTMLIVAVGVTAYWLAMRP